MGWPIASDYDDAIQNPQSCFEDTDLGGASVVLSPLGAPWVDSGSFASVYQLVTHSGTRYAVRCFLRQTKDQRRRYEIFANYMENCRPPFLTKFDYLQKGIRVGTEWYPIVKMEWVEGRTLDGYIGCNLRHPSRLAELMAQFQRIVQALRGLHAAHGDLQHGNMLITTAGAMRLVDYDGVFVPPIADECGHKSPELGHPNYQHPNRTPDDFDENLDNFSALVIYLSLRALYQDPSLWDEYYTGQNLILSAENYKNSADSIFTRLTASPEPGTKALATILQNLCKKPVEVIPTLDEILASIPPPPPPPPELSIQVTDDAGLSLEEIEGTIRRTGWKATRACHIWVASGWDTDIDVEIKTTSAEDDKAISRDPNAFRLAPFAKQKVSIMVPRTSAVQGDSERNIVINGRETLWYGRHSSAELPLKLKIKNIPWPFATPRNAILVICALFIFTLYITSFSNPEKQAALDAQQAMVEQKQKAQTTSRQSVIDFVLASDLETQAHSSLDRGQFGDAKSFFENAAGNYRTAAEHPELKFQRDSVKFFIGGEYVANPEIEEGNNFEIVWALNHPGYVSIFDTEQGQPGLDDLGNLTHLRNVLCRNEQSQTCSTYYERVLNPGEGQMIIVATRKRLQFSEAQESHWPGLSSEINQQIRGIPHYDRQILFPRHFRFAVAPTQ
jgi:hypothetical protein